MCVWVCVFLRWYFFTQFSCSSLNADISLLWTRSMSGVYIFVWMCVILFCVYLRVCVWQASRQHKRELTSNEWQDAAIFPCWHTCTHTCKQIRYSHTEGLAVYTLTLHWWSWTHTQAAPGEIILAESRKQRVVNTQSDSCCCLWQSPNKNHILINAPA